ncbi:MAG: NepR family anti-sigma factor [Aliidongia sp.]
MRKRASADRGDGREAPSAAKNDKAPGSESRPAEVNSHIGSLLRVMHDSVLNEPVPDRFLELLREIESRGGDVAAGPSPTPSGPEPRVKS